MGVTSRPYSHFPSSPPPGRPRRRGSRPGLLRWVNYLQHNVKRSKFTSKELLQNPCIASRTPRRWCRCHGDGGLPHGPEIQRSDMSIFRSAMSIIHMSGESFRITATSDKRCRCEVQRL
uniref:Uncharacterized protein n=1 Tax=Oryza punctata TaxID=4537 RepID=A0A0E0LT63_ORYPU